MKIKIRRNIPALNVDNRPIPGCFKQIVEDAELLSRNSTRGAIVRLANGVILYRKNKDIIQLEAQSEQSN